MMKSGFITFFLMLSMALLQSACTSTHGKEHEPFSTCQPIDSLEYYPYRSLEYHGHQRAFRNDFTKAFNATSPVQNPTKAHYIFVHYFINCNGEIGDFMIHGMSKEYRQVAIEEPLVDQIVASTKQTKNWRLPRNKEGENIDATYSFTLKINEQNQLEEIIL